MTMPLDDLDLLDLGTNRRCLRCGRTQDACDGHCGEEDPADEGEGELSQCGVTGFEEEGQP
jgi:hypothetical protein